MGFASCLPIYEIYIYIYMLQILYILYFLNKEFSTKNHYTWYNFRARSCIKRNNSHTFNSSSPCRPKNILKLTKPNTSSKDVNKYCQLYECFRKWWYPQIIHFNRVFHYKPSILEVFPIFLVQHPYTTEATKTNGWHPKNRSRIPIPIGSMYSMVYLPTLWLIFMVN